MGADMEAYLVEDLYVRYLEDADLLEVVRKSTNQAWNTCLISNFSSRISYSIIFGRGKMCSARPRPGCSRQTPSLAYNC